MASVSMTSPAPHRSSTAGRSTSPGHRSPDATTATGPRTALATHSAQAEALRREAPTTSALASPSCRQMAAPLGDGSTSLLVTVNGPPGSVARRTDTGDRLTPVGPASLRPTASTAPRVAAKAAAEASRNR